MTDTIKPRLLVSGASGRLGRKVLERLRDRSDVTLLAATRSPDLLVDTTGIEVRRADFDAPETLAGAFQDTDALLLISTNELGEPGRRIRQHRNAITAAVADGVRHIVYTSMPDPAGSTAIPFAPDHQATEEALVESGLGYTVLRVAWYAENLSDLGLLPAVLASGEWPTSAGEGRIAYVPVDDVARAAAAALLGADGGRHVYDITGPEAHTVLEIARIVGGAYGRTIRARQLTDEELARRLEADGIPAPLAFAVVVTDANTRAGRFNTVSDSVRELTGRPPAGLREYFARLAGTRP